MHEATTRVVVLHPSRVYFIVLESAAWGKKIRSNAALSLGSWQKNKETEGSTRAAQAGWLCRGLVQAVVACLQRRQGETSCSCLHSSSSSHSLCANCFHCIPFVLSLCRKTRVCRSHGLDHASPFFLSST